MEKKCVICKNPKDESLKFFNEAMFNKAKRFLIAHQRHHLRHENVVLPESLSENECCYHSSCYRSFIAVQKKYLLDENANNAEAAIPERYLFI